MHVFLSIYSQQMVSPDKTMLNEVQFLLHCFVFDSYAVLIQWSVCDRVTLCGYKDADERFGY